MKERMGVKEKETKRVEEKKGGRKIRKNMKERWKQQERGRQKKGKKLN